MRTKFGLVLACMLGLAACGDDDMTMTDGGTEDAEVTLDADTPDTDTPDTDTPDTDTPDTDTPDTDTGDVCDSAEAITLTVGEQAISGDLTGAPRDLTLGEECGGNFDSGAQLLALTLPAGDEFGVRFSLESETTGDLDTVVQIRTNADCEDIAEAQCFDDIAQDNFASGGGFVAEGGSTIYMVVTGFSFIQDGEREPTIAEGPWAGTIEVFEPNAPVLTEVGAGTFDDGDVLNIAVNGSDADGDATGLTFSFLDAADEVVALTFEDGSMQDEFTFGFNAPGQDGNTELENAAMTISGLGGFTDQLESVTQLRVAITDSLGLTSETMVTAYGAGTEVELDGDCSGLGDLCAPGTLCRAETNLCFDPVVAEGEDCSPEDVSCETGLECREATGLCFNPIAGFGEDCSAEDVMCADGFTCTDDVCAVSAEVATACEAASAEGAVTVAAAVTFDAVVPATGEEEEGLFTGTCGSTAGLETLHTVTVPAGEFDLLAATATDDEDADSVVYIQNPCGAETVACNDDFGGELTSRAVVENAAAGTYTIVVEAFGGAEAATTFATTVSLRPVVAAGAACDPEEVMNRCATSACPEEGAAVCPAAE